VKRTSHGLMTLEILISILIVAATSAGCDDTHFGGPGGSGGAGQGTGGAPGVGGSGGAMPGTGGTTMGNGQGGAMGTGGSGSGGLLGGGNGGSAAGGNGGTGGGSGVRACEQVQCLRPYECVRTCGGPVEYSGCCPCEAPLFDNFNSMGCGGTAGSGGMGTGGIAGGGQSGTGAGGGLGGDGGGSQDAASDASPACWSDAGVIATEAKACEQDSDCTKVQSTPCCGSPVIVGLSKQAEAYTPCYHLTCPPGLDCPIGLPVAEDGQAATLDSAEVHCVVQGSGGACTTNAPRADGGPGTLCTSDTDCSAGLKCCYPCGTAGCQNQCIQTSSATCPLYP